MTTYYGDKRDFRTDMRNPHSSARIHAICRRLSGAASQSTPIYSAMYWSACEVDWQSQFNKPGNYRHSLDIEWDSRYPEYSQLYRDKIWAWAIARVQSVYSEAQALHSSIEW